MSKLQLSLTSLIAVLPAAFLAFLLVNVMLTDSQNLSTMAFVVLGVTLAAAIATVLIPAAVWVGGRSKPKLATAKVSTGTAKHEAADSEDVETLDEDLEEDIDGEIEAVEDDEEYSAGESLGDSNEFELDESDEMMTEDLEADVDTEPVEDFEDFDLEEEEVKEEPKPKKKKR